VEFLLKSDFTNSSCANSSTNSGCAVIFYASCIEANQKKIDHGVIIKPTS